MTTLPTRARRAILMPTLARGLRYASTIKAKTAFSGGSQVIKLAQRVAPLGKLSTVFGSHRSAAFNLPGSSMVSNPLELGKLKVSQTARTCVKLALLRKNRRSKFSLASAEKSSIIMNVSTYQNQKRGGVSSTNRARTTIAWRCKVSLIPCILPQHEYANNKRLLRDSAVLS